MRWPRLQHSQAGDADECLQALTAQAGSESCAEARAAAKLHDSGSGSLVAHYSGTPEAHVAHDSGTPEAHDSGTHVADDSGTREAHDY